MGRHELRCRLAYVQAVHSGSAAAVRGDSGSPQNRHWASTSGTPEFYNADSPNVDMDADALPTAGGSQSHQNLMPFLCIHFIIALVGIYPSRS